MTRAQAPTGSEVVLVAAVARNGVIGRGGGLPWRLPEDLQHFKAVTLGHPMVMGRRTFESIGRPLPGRTSVVVTSDPHWRADGVSVACALADALDLAAHAPGGQSVMVIGGGQLYEQALPLAHRLELTRLAAAYEGDTYFPPIDEAQWRTVRRVGHEGYEFVTLERAGLRAAER